MAPLTPAAPHGPDEDEFEEYNGHAHGPRHGYGHQDHNGDPTIRVPYGRRGTDSHGVAVVAKRVIEPIKPFVDVLWKVLAGALIAWLIRFASLPNDVERIDRELQNETQRAKMADSISQMDREALKRSVEGATDVLLRLELQACANLNSTDQYRFNCPNRRP